MSIKLFVDDLRDCPEGWVQAKTVTEAIRILADLNVSEVSLDHDIQCTFPCSCDDEQHCIGSCLQDHASPETFEPVARYIKLMHDIMDPYGVDGHGPKVTFHTSNPIGGKNMAAILGMEYVPRKYPEGF